MKIRVKFTKEGDLKFIGHLDVMRFFQKVLRRAGVAICYSAGFSPHQIMSFSAPLSLGLTSEGEYMDIEVSESGPSEEMVAKLNAETVEGIRVLSWRLLPDGADNAMAGFAAADYTVKFRPRYEPDDLAQFRKEFEAFCAQDEILVEKQTKKSVKQINIRPLIYRLEIGDDEVFMQVASGSANHLKPEMVFKAFYDSKGQELSPFALLIHRLEMYTDLGDENERKLISLQDVGTEI